VVAFLLLVVPATFPVVGFFAGAGVAFTGEPKFENAETACDAADPTADAAESTAACAVAGATVVPFTSAAAAPVLPPDAAAPELVVPVLSPLPPVEAAPLPATGEVGVGVPEPPP
jgi:hypothetical protein